MTIKIEGLETGLTMIRLEYLGKNYTTGCLFTEEAGEKIQMLINAALQYENRQD
jgi:hypothetical protein